MNTDQIISKNYEKYNKLTVPNISKPNLTKSFGYTKEPVIPVSDTVKNSIYYPTTIVLYIFHVIGAIYIEDVELVL